MHEYIYSCASVVYGLTVHTGCWGPTDLSFFSRKEKVALIVHSDRGQSGPHCGAHDRMCRNIVHVKIYIQTIKCGSQHK